MTNELRYITDAYDDYKAERRRVMTRLRDELEELVDKATYEQWKAVHDMVRTAYARGATKTELRRAIRAHNNQGSWNAVWDKRPVPTSETFLGINPNLALRPNAKEPLAPVPAATVEAGEHGWLYTLNREPANWPQWSTLAQRATQWVDELHYEAEFPVSVWVDETDRAIDPDEDIDDRTTQVKRRWFNMHRDLWLDSYQELKRNAV